MQFNSWYLTDKGRRRESNQDSCLVNKELGLFILADGMGGHSGGEVASSIAVETVEEVFIKKRQHTQMNSNQQVLHTLQEAYIEASHRIYDKAMYERPELSGMGTTLVAAALSHKSLIIGNVGDSRCYLFQKPYLWQITEDHSLVNEQIRGGMITEEQAKNISGKNIITRSVGFEREVIPDFLEREIAEGDLFILCSDGLSNMVEEQELAEIFKKYSPEEALKRALDKALANGGDDNITIVVIEFLENSEKTLA